VKPTCSVVIPVRDGERFIGAAIESVLAQDWPVEIVAVDDGSRDGTAAVVARYPSVVLLRRAPEGPSQARNAGVAASSGPYVALLDADDVWLPGKLAAQVGVLEARPELGYVVARYRNVLEEGAPRPRWLHSRELGEPQDGGVSNLVARRTALERIGPFHADDWGNVDWLLRARDAGVASALVPEVLLLRRVHQTNLSHVNRARGGGLPLWALRASIARRRGA
jgi:glycosyltransferase involved in cell wall biosynthesis